MQHFFSLKKPFLGLLTAFTLLTSLIFLAKSSIFNSSSSTLSTALILDFTLTIPFIYFLLIRKSKIPKTTVVPLFILGIIVASFVIPKENQSLINIIKTWLVPVVEISVLIYISLKIKRLVSSYKKNKNEALDFYDALKIATKKLLPKLPAKLLTMEIAVFYYGFFKWKKTKLPNNAFTYHKNSGSPALFGAIILIIAVELTSIHFLMIKSNPVLAYILLGLSIYSVFQIFGFLKSLFFRPIKITSEKLYLKYGILAETTIKINTIKSVELFTKDINDDKNIIKLSPLVDLESHNILIHLNEEHLLNGIYGTKKTFQSIVFFVDKKEKFKQDIQTLINAID